MRRVFCALLLALGLCTVASALEGPAPGAASAQTLKLPDGPGSLRGLANDPSVSLFSGQVSYEIPLELPGARHTFRPSLALTYRGDLGNGPFGVGWSMRSVAIRRSTRLGVPRFDGSDELDLVGIGAEGRLVAVGDGTYRVEGRGNDIKIVPENGGYRVWDSDGSQYVLGESAAARQGTSVKVLAWLVQDVQDTTGQHITYAYAADRGQVYLSTVSWGPNNAFRAVLELAPRPDTTTSYREGFAVTSGQRVAAVRVESFGTVLRRYVLGYDQTFALSRLHTVTMTGRDGAGALPPLTLQYAGVGAPQLSALGATDGWQLNQRGVSLVDIDGDGAMDLLRVEPGDSAYKRNLGGSFDAPVLITGADAASLAASRLMDVEGKARPNLVTSSSDGWHPYRLSGTAWSALSTWSNTADVPLFDGSVVVADLNGDGRVDSVQGVTAGLSVRFGNAAGLGATVSQPMIGGELLPGTDVLWSDMNGDGLADVVQLGQQSINIYFGIGDGTFTTRTQVAYPAAAAAVSHDRLRLADLDRDGLMDLVVVSPSTVSYFPGRPTTARFAASPIALQGPEYGGDDVVVTVGDVNGNGSQDVVWSSPRGMWLLDLAGPTSAGMLVSVDNGSGKTLAIDYAASATLARQDATAGQPWAHLLQVSIPVAVRTTMQLGSGDPPRVTDYQVRDGFWDANEYTFGGFLFGRTIAHGGSPARDLVTETTFNAGVGVARVLRGTPVTVTRKSGAGVLFDVTTNVWVAAQLSDLTTDPLERKPVVTETWTDHYEGATTPVRTHKSFTLDSQARVYRERDDGRTDQTGDEKVTVRFFASNSSAWLRDRVYEVQLFDGSNTLLSDTRTYYGSATTVEALGTIGSGWVRRVDGWLAGTTGRWVTLESHGYDVNGNEITFTQGGVTHTFQFDGNALHPIYETVAPASGQTLTWNASWDNVQGMITDLTDPSGAITHVTYDSLGRQASLAMGSAPPHVYYQYDWTSSRPRTTTFVYDGDPATLPATLPAWSAGNGWRQSVQVYNGNFEVTSAATRLADASWLVSELRQRDGRGTVVWRSQPFRYDGSDPPQVAPVGTPGAALAYDALDRATSETLPNGAVRSSTFGIFSLRTDTTDLAPVISLLDGQGRVIHTERTLDGVLEATDTRYDGAGRILSFTSGSVVSTFTYDTLGRLIATHDPDVGARTLTWNDAGQLVDQLNGDGQHASFSYDGAGRLIEEKLDGVSQRRFHYDTPRTGGLSGFTGGRLAWAEDPEGSADFAYDGAGRVAQTRRTIRGVTVNNTQAFAPSGLPRGVSYDDGFAYTMSYDPAGRLTAIPGLWSAISLDAAGRILDQQLGNGITGHTERDSLGAARLQRYTTAAGAVIYDATATRTSFGALATVTDDDGVGLDHSGSFGYDGGGRLRHAVIGSGSNAYTFDHSYDALQNMTSRLVAGPRATSILSGTYKYGELGHGPRQLTSIVGTTTTGFNYDGAGRQIAQTGSVSKYLTYDALDRLLTVTSSLNGTMTSSYGFDGQRELTQEPDGTITRWFSAAMTEQNGTHDHFVSVGDTVVARVRITPGILRTGALAATPLAGALALIGLFGGLTVGGRRGRRRWQALGAIGLLAFAQLGGMGCSHGDAAGSASSAITGIPLSTTTRLYFHQGFGAGPTLFTNDSGAIVEERRFEPFGDDLDALVPGQAVGAVNFKTEATNELNKPIDAATHLSYHGARWYEPDDARWLTPDPPVKAPDTKFASAPWNLNPYDYVNQNPVSFWDPDGRSPAPVFYRYADTTVIFVNQDVTTKIVIDNASDPQAPQVADPGRVEAYEASWRSAGYGGDAEPATYHVEYYYDTFGGLRPNKVETHPGYFGHNSQPVTSLGGYYMSRKTNVLVADDSSRPHFAIVGVIDPDDDAKASFSIGTSGPALTITGVPGEDVNREIHQYYVVPVPEAVRATLEGAQQAAAWANLNKATYGLAGFTAGLLKAAQNF